MKTRYLADDLGLPANWEADRYSTTIELRGPRQERATLVLPYGNPDMAKLREDAAKVVATATHKA